MSAHTPGPNYPPFILKDEVVRLEAENAKLREINKELLRALKDRDWLLNHEINAVIANAEGRE